MPYCKLAVVLFSFVQIHQVLKPSTAKYINMSHHAILFKMQTIRNKYKQKIIKSKSLLEHLQNTSLCIIIKSNEILHTFQFDIKLVLFALNNRHRWFTFNNFVKLFLCNSCHFTIVLRKDEE